MIVYFIWTMLKIFFFLCSLALFNLFIYFALTFFRGAGPGCNTREISDRLVTLKSEIEHLNQREKELDQHKSWVQQSIKNVTDEVSNCQYPFW